MTQMPCVCLGQAGLTCPRRLQEQHTHKHHSPQLTDGNRTRKVYDKSQQILTTRTHACTLFVCTSDMQTNKPNGAQHGTSEKEWRLLAAHYRNMDNPQSITINSGMYVHTQTCTCCSSCWTRTQSSIKLLVNMERKIYMLAVCSSPTLSLYLSQSSDFNAGWMGIFVWWRLICIVQFLVHSS